MIQILLSVIVFFFSKSPCGEILQICCFIVIRALIHSEAPITLYDLVILASLCLSHQSNGLSPSTFASKSPTSSGSICLRYYAMKDYSGHFNPPINLHQHQSSDALGVEHRFCGDIAPGLCCKVSSRPFLLHLSQHCHSSARFDLCPS